MSHTNESTELQNDVELFDKALRDRDMGLVLDMILQSPWLAYREAAGQSLLSQCAEHDIFDIDWLLDCGVNPNIKTDVDQTTALHDYVDSDDHCSVMQLLNKGADTELVDAEGCTPLHCAAKNGKSEMTRLLLDYGADSQARNNSGDEPLHLAVYNQHMEVVRLLLGADADPTSRNNENNSAVLIADLVKNRKMLRLLTRFAANQNGIDGVVYYT